MREDFHKGKFIHNVNKNQIIGDYQQNSLKKRISDYRVNHNTWLCQRFTMRDELPTETVIH